jgi:serine/threonine protein kinase/tetratricopeptide (TPR) repeat protein
VIGRTLSHYKVLSEISRGGMGIVYRALDLKLDREVALKVLPPELVADPERKSRFVQEAQAAAKLEHPHIAVVYEIDEIDGVTFIVMELIQGKQLKDITNTKKLTLARALELGTEIAEGLARAHDKGIVHRDLKPANIMVTEEGHAKIIDFGLAKLVEPLGGEGSNLETAVKGQTDPGQVLGTVSYMSPEQARGESVDHRTDIFSFGIAMYEMLTGEPPFKAPSAPEILSAIINAPTPQLGSSVASDTAPENQRILDKCLAKEPRERYQTMKDLVVDLRAALRKLESGAIATISESPPSIAVLPFADMSPQKDQDYFCDGLAEEIINALTQLEGLHVVARTSAFAFKGKLEDVREIGRNLNVNTVLDGSVRTAGDRLRITTQLVNVSDGYQLWSERFDRKLEDIFAIQDEISLAVVNKLKVKLLSGEKSALLRRHTEDREAYDHYLKGRYFFNRRHRGDFERAIACFQEAIALSPDYALPHVGIADVFNILGLWGYMRPSEAFSKAKIAAGRALEIDDTLAEAHVAMAFIQFFYERDWNRADYHFKHAFQLKLSNALAYTWSGLHLLAAERYDEATATARRAVELDPLSPMIHTAAASVHIGAGQVDAAFELLHKAIELDPNLPTAQFWLGWCFAAQGRDEEALVPLQKAAEAGLLGASGILGLILARSGKREQALDRLDKFSTEHYVPFVTKALIHAGLGDRERYVELIEKAHADREPLSLGFIKKGLWWKGIIPSSWVAEAPHGWDIGEAKLE